METGGVFYDLPPNVWELVRTEPDLAWQINERFLRQQLESGKDFEVVGVVVKEILEGTERTLKDEIQFLVDVAEREFGYVRIGDSWIAP